MGLSKSSIERADISTYAVKFKYSASYASSSAINYGITVNRGMNTSFISNPTEFLVYKLVQQLYYNSYITGALSNTASYWDDNLQSTAASGTFDNDYRYLPTESGAEITVISIPRIVFGEVISRKSFRISSANYNLIDDGNGNIIDSNNNNVHVGNILYRQGVIVITNLDYENALIQALPTTTTTTTTSTTSTTTTAPPTTTSTTTTTTTGAPAIIYWQNSQLASPYIDGDLFINDDGIGIVAEYVDNSGNFTVSANSSIYSQQNSMGGTIGNYRLYIENISDSIVIYDNISSASSLPAAVNAYTFIALPGKSYYVSASVAELPTTTTTTTTSTTSTTTTAPTTTSTTSTTTTAPTTTSTTSTTTTAPTTTTTSTTTSTTTEAPTTTTTTTSTTTSTTTAAPTTTTSTTSTTTTEAPTTTTTTTSTTTSTTTVAPTTTTTSTTSTTTTSAPTTTTTTLAPVSFAASSSCVGGSGEILANNYTGGNGTYQWIAIANTPANAISYVNGVGGTRFAAGTSYNFTSLSDGTYYIALRDSVGNTGVTPNPGISIACSTTTTTSTTTSTTTEAPTTTSTTTTTTTAGPTTSTTTTTTTAAVGILYCVGYSSGSNCCVALDDYEFSCNYCTEC